MPILSRFTSQAGSLSREIAEPAVVRSGFDATRRDIFSTCANPHCSSGWLKVWRSKTVPVLEGGWCCSPECTETQVALALRREVELMGRTDEARSHRIPLGLLMLEQGWITRAQLRGALAAQRAAGAGRIGYWLVQGQGVSEQLVTRGLGMQSACPVLGLEGHQPESMAAFLPRFFVDAFGAMPIRSVAGRLLYLGFDSRPDPVLALALERMSSMRVESGLVPDSLFRSAHATMLKANYPSVELIEAVSEPVLAHELARRVEQARPVESRLVRVHDCLWLRMWKRQPRGPLPEVHDVLDLICSLKTRL